MGCEKQKEFQTNLDLPYICQIVAEDENKGTDVISGYSFDIVDITLRSVIEDIDCNVVNKWRSTMLIIAGNVKRPS